MTSLSDVRTFISLVISALWDWSYSFACLVLRAVAATAIFVALSAGALAGQKDARNERPYIYSPDFLAVGVRLLLFGVRRFRLLRLLGLGGRWG